jgi:siroheme synthase-like protein
MSRSFDLMIAVNTAKSSIVVVGGGPVGERKIGTLLAAGVHVVLISPDVTPVLEEQARTGLICWKARRACAQDFKKGGWAVLAVPPRQTREMIEWARSSGTRCNCCSLPEEGDWALTAQFRSEGVLFGVSSRGDAPSLAARWKRKLMDMLEEAATR